MAINLRVTGKYFVFMNATVSCQGDSATGENDIYEGNWHGYIHTESFCYNFCCHSMSTFVVNDIVFELENMKMQYHQDTSCIYHSFLQDEDFTFTERTVQFPMPFSPNLAPSETEVPLNIAITDDQIHEETECFTCTINTTSVPEKELPCPSPITTICIVDPGEYSLAVVLYVYISSVSSYP